MTYERREYYLDLEAFDAAIDAASGSAAAGCDEQEQLAEAIKVYMSIVETKADDAQRKNAEAQ